MFNQNIKERYIEEKYFTTTLPKGYLECQFNKLEKYETEYDKDVCCFTTREIRTFYKLLNVSSLEILACLNSQLSLYTQWCLQNNFVIDNQNHFLEFNLNLLNRCINPVKFNKKIVSREDVIRWCEQIPNPKDQVVLLGLFEGMKGKDFCDFVKLKPGDIKGNTVHLASGRDIYVSDQLLEYMQDSINETKYYSCTKEGIGDVVLDLIDRGYVLKYYPNTRDDTSDFQKGRVVYNGISRSLKYLGVFNIVKANSIYESGKIHMIKERSKELGMTPEDYIYSDHIKEVEERFDCKILRKSYMLKYKGFLGM